MSLRNGMLFTAQKMKFFIKNLFSKCDEICNFLRIWPHLLKKSLMENFIFCAVILASVDGVRGMLAWVAC